ncbi:10239_t:CDS:2, partial [Funneliformis geosporum]
EDGLLLQQKYKKKQELANKFNFDPKKKVDNLIESMKKAIKKGKKKRTDGSGGGNHKNPNSSDANSSDSEDDYSSDDSNNGNGGGKEYVDNLYLSSQINLFVRKIKKVIKEKAEIEQEKPKKARGNAKKEIEDFAKRIGYCAKKAHDAYSKHSKRQKERLALKGKSLEEAREDNKKAREEEKKTRDELEEQERKNKELEKELEQARNKVNDPSLSEEERAK